MTLERRIHGRYLAKALARLSSSFTSLDASQPWLCYWILHAHRLLDMEVSEDDKKRFVRRLAGCQCPLGGFGGGQGQLAHLAPTYAAVMALACIGTPEAYDAIDRYASVYVV